MTTYIGDIPLASVQEITLSKSEGVDEIDLINEDSNIVFNGVEESDNIEISFTLVKSTHPEELSVEKQSEEVKSLASQDYVNNSFRDSGLEGKIVIGDINVPEDSTNDTIREGTISGNFLSWPKHEQGSPIQFDKRILGELVYEYLMEGQINLNDVYISASLEKSFILYSDKTSTDSGFDYTDPSIGRDLRVAGDFSYVQMIEPNVESFSPGDYSNDAYGDGIYGQ